MIGRALVLAVITARGGSKGVPRKNLLTLGGKPMIAWTVEAACTARTIDRVIVSSDNAEIIDAAVESFDDDVLVLRLRTQSGTYVKELVSGDGGRTKPNLSEELGVPCEVTALDVVEIIDITEV